MLYLVGLGLGDAQDITVKGLEAVRRCRRVYLEAYTSALTVGKEALVGAAAAGSTEASAPGGAGLADRQAASGAGAREKHVRGLHMLCFVGETISLPREKTGTKRKRSFLQLLMPISISRSSDVWKS